MPRRLATFLAILPLLSPGLRAQGLPAQIEQARQLSATPLTADPGTDPAVVDFPSATPAASDDDSFGAQLILKRQERPQPFSSFAEISAFATNNVALTRRDTHGDSFLVAGAGAAFSQRFAYDLRVDAGVRSSLFRYGEYRELDFQSIDAGAGITWSPPLLQGAELTLHYTFTDLSTAERIREFYTNHAILLGVQKVIPFARAHGIYFGATAQWSCADPKEAGRDEYAAFLGYRAQLTRHFDAELSYRYARYVYRDGDGREDDNHALSLAVHFVPVEWLSLAATTLLSANRSNRSVFDYDVANAGAGLQLSIKF
jgi:hypothetical protein